MRQNSMATPTTRRCLLKLAGGSALVGLAGCTTGRHGQPGMRPPQDTLPTGARRKLSDLNHMVETALGRHD